MFGYHGVLGLILPADSSGKVHGLTLAIPVNICRVRKGPGLRVKRNTCWRVCLFSALAKALFEWIQKAFVPNIYNTLLKGTAGCDLGAFSPPLCLREIQNNARELDFLPGWSPPGKG